MRAATAVNDVAQTNEDTPVVVNVLANDTGAGLRVGSVGQPAHGTAVVLDASAGTIQYTPNPDCNGMDSFSYTITEGSSMYCAATGHYYQYVAGSITWADARSAAALMRLYGLQGYLVTITSAAEQTFVNTKLSGNTAWMGASDEASEGVWCWVTGPEQGQQFCQETGGGAYANPAGGYTATGSCYNNWNGGEPNNYNGNEDYGQFLAGSTGLWNDLPSSSTVAGYVVEYGGMTGDAPAFPTATVTVTVNPVNDAPVITEGSSVSVTMDEDSSPTAFALTLHAGDIDGDSLSWHIQMPAGHGTASVDAAGPVHYVPNANWNGSDSFAVQVTDGHGGSATTTVTVTVRPRNDPPVNTAAPTLSGTPHPGQTLTVTQGAWNDEIDAPLIGNFTYKYYWQRSSDGGTTWANINGVTTSGSYLVTQNDLGCPLRCVVDCLDHCNGNPPDVTGEARSNLVTVANMVPSIQEGGVVPVTMDEDGAPAPWSLALHASDGDSDSIAWSIAAQALHGTAGVTGAGGTATVQYAPVADWNGSDSFVVQASDPWGGRATATVSVTVTPVNDPPLLTVPVAVTVHEDTPASISGVAVADIDANETPAPGNTVQVSLAVSRGTLSLSSAAGCSFATGDGSADASLIFTGTITDVNAALSSLSYTGDPDDNGSDALVMAISDLGHTGSGGARTASAATVITVVPVNDPPLFTKGADQTVLEDCGPQTVASWATSISAGPADESPQTLTFHVSNTNSALFSVPPSIDAAGALSYTPAADANGTATITVVLQDNGGTANNGVDTSAPQTFTITVTPVNDPPLFTKGADQTVLEDCGTQTVTGWATAISAGPADEFPQTLTFRVTGNTNPSLFSSFPCISPEGVLSYTPAADANGTATITVVLQDNGGTANGGADTSAPQTFTITVTPVVDIADDSAATLEDHQLSIPVLANDTFEGLPSIIAVSTPSSGSVQIVDDSSLLYTPALNRNGVDSFTYTVASPAGVTETATVTITVVPVNDPPSFTAGSAQTVLEDCGPQTVASWATSISAGPADESPQTLTFRVTGNTNPSLFSSFPCISPEGVLSYAPAPDANGTATITVVLQDNGGAANGGVDTSAPQTFTITVTPVNDPPSFLRGTDMAVDEDAPEQTITAWATCISAGPVDESGQRLTFTVANDNPALFTKQPSLSSDGTLSYRVAPDRNGAACLTITLTDDATAGGSALTTPTQTARVIVRPINDPPVCLQLPTIMGTGVVGTLISSEAGQWDDHLDQVPGHIALTLQWMRSTTADGAAATLIPGANGGTYEVREEDIGSCIGLLVTASDDGEGTPVSMQTSALALTWIRAVENDRVLPTVTLLRNVPASVTGSSLTLEGIIRDAGSGIRTVTLNGAPIALYTNGSFRETVPVSRGRNTIVLTATDNAGNIWSKTYQVVGMPAPAGGSRVHTIVLSVGSRTMTVDDRHVLLDAVPVIREGRTLVPFRAIVESLGGTVSWNAKLGKVTIARGGTTIELWIGKSTARVNGTSVRIDTANAKVVPFITNGRTMLPLRFIAEALGLDVEWNASTQVVTLTLQP